MTRAQALIVLAFALSGGCAKTTLVIPRDGIDPATGKPVYLRIPAGVRGPVAYWDADKGAWIETKDRIDYPVGWIVKAPAKPTTRPAGANPAP